MIKCNNSFLPHMTQTQRKTQNDIVSNTVMAKLAASLEM